MLDMLRKGRNAGSKVEQIKPRDADKRRFLALVGGGLASFLTSATPHTDEQKQRNSALPSDFTLPDFTRIEKSIDDLLQPFDDEAESSHKTPQLQEVEKSFESRLQLMLFALLTSEQDLCVPNTLVQHLVGTRVLAEHHFVSVRFTPTNDGVVMRFELSALRGSPEHLDHISEVSVPVDVSKRTGGAKTAYEVLRYLLNPASAQRDA